jgi:hypothetical protein
LDIFPEGLKVDIILKIRLHFQAWRQSSWRWPLLIGILLLILLLIALITFVTLRRKKGRPEYTQGREQGREKQ